ncbi:MAG: S9 family peptidase [Bdellovibrionales bacterium]|nr:S9 family peptidase [Bdellovibrionales bacterium]
MIRLKYLLVGLLLVLTACATGSKTDGLTVSFEEFQKILEPRSMVLLEGKDTLLVNIAMPGDKYPKVYRYRITEKKFTEEYDHGQTISQITEDRTGKNIYLLIDDNGDENYKIYTYDPNTKKTTLLFGKKGFKSYPINSDESGKSLFIVSNYENKAVYSIYKMDMATKKMERVSDGKTNLAGGLVSLDGTKIAAARYLSNNENQVFVIDTDKKTTTPMFKKKNSVFHPSFFDSNSKSLYGTTDYKRDRTGCASIPLNKPNHVYYKVEKKDRDISCGYGEWSKLYFLHEIYKGRTELKLFRKMWTQSVEIPQLLQNQSVSMVAFDRTNNQMILKFTAANNPGSLYKFDTKTLKTAHVMDLNKSKIPMADLAVSEDFEYKSFDGMKIHGILIAKPEWKTSGKKYPLVIWPHGGPDSFERHSYRSWFQYLALNGFVVYAPNYRGSAGYGKKFETLNDKDWGGAHIKDLVSARQAVEQLPWVDEKNAFIFGGSFGGYSTLATATFQPDAFKAAVGVVAIGNLFTFMKSIPPDEAWQTEFKREMGDPVKDKKLYTDRSPFFHVDKIQIPLQIYQAENDVRTVKAEMDTFVAELRKKGKPVEYTVLKDVGHGLERPESRKQIMEGTVKFFKSMIR